MNATSVFASVLIFAGSTSLPDTSLAGDGFRWSAEDRFGRDDDGDGIIDYVPLAADAAVPNAYILSFDCLGGADGRAAFQWYVDGTAVELSPTNVDDACDGSYPFPGEGDYVVMLEQSDSLGVVTTYVETVRVQDFLIVALGDSYGSGEGIPEVPYEGFLLNEYIDAIEDELAALARVEVADFDVDLKWGSLSDAKALLNTTKDNLREIKDACGGTCKKNGVKYPCCLRPKCWKKIGKKLTSKSQYNKLIKALEEAVDNAAGAVRLAQLAYDAAVTAYNYAVATYQAASNIVTTTANAFNAQKAVWQREIVSGRGECNRSSWSSQAQAALAIERADTKSSVTFVHAACSGATVNDLLDTGDQLDLAQSVIGGRTVDALLLSIGGNDANFSDVVKACISQERCYESAAISSDLDSIINGMCDALSTLPFFSGCKTSIKGSYARSAQQIFESGLSALVETDYPDLNRAIDQAGLAAPDDVYIASYPYLTRRDSGSLCGGGAIAGISASEIAWFDGEVSPSVNGAVADAAASFGWTYVADVADDSLTHGYCANDRWTVKLIQSFKTQGDYNGFLHPNKSGASNTGVRLFEAMQPKLLPGLYHTATPEIVGMSGPSAIDEGGRASFTASASDADGDAILYAWQVDDDNLSFTASANQQTVTLRADDDAIATLTVTPSDAFSGAGTSATLAVQVNNVAPFIDEHGFSVAVIGVPVELTVSFSDPGVKDTHSLSVDWGDGGGVVAYGAAASPVRVSHVFSTAGEYHVRLQVEDDDGGAAVRDATLPVDGDNDGDGIGDSTDADDDNDGVTDVIEHAIGTDPWLADTDGDGYDDLADACPLDPTDWADTDEDGICDNADLCPLIPDNCPPEAVDDQFSTDEDVSLVADVLANDIDLDGDGLSVVQISAAQHGSVEIVDGGQAVRYVPSPNFYGTDSFRYVVHDGWTDGWYASDEGVVTVTVLPVNDPPIAEADLTTTDEDSTVVFDVRSNDRDVDIGDSLTVVAFDLGGSDAAVALNANGWVRYTPAPSFQALGVGQIGSDHFQYTVADRERASDSAGVTVTIHGRNDAPVASEDAANTTEDHAVEVDVLANDHDVDRGDTLSVTAFDSNGTRGSASIIDAKTVRYDPSGRFEALGVGASAVDQVVVFIADAQNATDSALLKISVQGVNDAPQAYDDAAGTNEDSGVRINVLANDLDVDQGDTLHVVSLDGAGTKGSVSLAEDSTVYYHPAGAFEWLATGETATDSFSYRIVDQHGSGASARVHVVVEGVNDAPRIEADLDYQQVQYSDGVSTISLTVSDIDSTELEVSGRWSAVGEGENGDGAQSLPLALSFDAAGCSGIRPLMCRHTVSGPIELPAGLYRLTLGVSDEELTDETAVHIDVAVEDAIATLNDDNPVAVGVAEDGGSSAPFSLLAQVRERLPDEATATPFAGDIGNAVVSLSLLPVGPGDSVRGRCYARGVAETGYDAVLTVACDFDEVPVNTYTTQLRVGGGSYSGGAPEGVITVYDPSLGIASGGGWFAWPGTHEKTNFGFTMKYNNPRNPQLRGSLLIVRHVPDGSIYRLKSSALHGLALGRALDEESGETYGWATFTGTATYLQPGMQEAAGDHGFIVHVEDRDEPGMGGDRIWLRTLNADGIEIPALSLEAPASQQALPTGGGSIAAPH